MVEKEYCNPNKFKPRLVIPKSNNSFYNTKQSGGFSTAIQGKNKNGKPEPGLNCLSNCVGYSLGRWMEILNNTSFTMLRPVNAGKMIQYADKSLEIGYDIPKIGAIMVWSEDNQAGHVCVVEKVISNTEIITSESGYGYLPFWVQTRKKGADGNWGQKSSYKFLGFIYNPAPCCQDKQVTTTEKIKPSTTISKTPIKNAIESAKSLDKKLSGVYKVVSSDGLNMRTGAGTNNDIIVNIPYGEKVQNYGYFTQVGTTKWLYVQCTLNEVKYTGFVSGSYLRMA